MTMDQAKNKLLAWAKSQFGYCEGANNWNRYADMPEISRLLGWNAQNQPWCNVFVLAAFTACFGLETGADMLYQPIGSGSALCRASAQFFRDAGAWRNRAEPGDVIFFYVGGEINHMGIVTRVVGGSVTTIEGNSSDMVAERVYPIGDARIAGYGRPRWELVADDPTEDINVPGKEHPQEQSPTASLVAVHVPPLRVGMGGKAVAAVQGVLHYQRYALGPDGVDGEFGPATRAAVLNFQIRNGLEPTGEIGPDEWAILTE